MSCREIVFLIFFLLSAAARSGAEIALTHLNASTHGHPFWKPPPRNLQVRPPLRCAQRAIALHRKFVDEASPAAALCSKGRRFITSAR